jgi:hypothetical protein
MKHTLKEDILIKNDILKIRNGLNDQEMIYDVKLLQGI